MKILICRLFRDMKTKRPEKILNGEEIRILRKILVTGLIKKRANRFTGIWIIQILLDRTGIILGAILIMNTEYFLITPGAKSYFKLEDATMNNKLDWIEDCYQTYNKGNWITKRIFKKVAVTKGDHHHCLIDAKKLSFYDYPGSEKQGYCSTDGRIWLCEECYHTVCELGHKLKIEPNTVKEIESAVDKGQKVVLSLDNVQYEMSGDSEQILVLHNGITSEYKNYAEMEKKQKFYGKLLKEIIDDVFVGVK